MKKMKIPALLTSLSVFTALMLGGCGGSAKPAGTSADKTDPSEPSAETAVSTEAPEPAVSPDAPANKGEMRGLTAAELIAEMKTGWNLGNSLDVTAKSETAWGNPVTTKQMIEKVSEKGFDVLRVPVTWYPHMDDNSVIETDFMDRVEEVVGYGLDCGMYVILNTHHEEEDWMIPDNEHIDGVEKIFKAIWEQIAERFGDYGDHLIFEGINEARVKGSENEWGGGTAEGRECVNRLNRAFFDLIRSSGGNNEKRLLLVTTYAQAISREAFDGLEIKFDDYTAFTLHAYTPYSFTYHSGESYETYDWDGHEMNSVKTVFKLIDRYLLSEGVPVIITECGAVIKKLEDGTLNTDAVCAWTKDYYGMAKEYGIPCVRWDNNYYYSGNELFGLLDRRACEWYDEKLVDAIMEVY